MDKKVVEKEAIIVEYLTGNSNNRKLGMKYGIDFRLIHSWDMRCQGKNEYTIQKQSVGSGQQGLSVLK